MLDTTKLTHVCNIAERALDVHAHEQKRKSAYLTLVDAYQAWKAEHEIGRVERNSPEWRRMQADTEEEYARFCVARDLEHNARRRLETAIRRYHAS